jgi:hypothetical protein
MNTRTPPEVKVLTLVQQFIGMMPPVDKAEILSELALVEKVHIPGTNFQMVPTEPHLWALIISANGRNWCLLAHWDAQQDGSSFVCTHVFAKGSGSIPKIEISRALRFYQQYKSQGGV